MRMKKKYKEVSMYDLKFVLNDKMIQYMMRGTITLMVRSFPVHLTTREQDFCMLFTFLYNEGRKLPSHN